ncbi:MAG: cation-transporting P-type ATPase [Myxococcales bacterium]|nr:cation-transporting P-type ATPase [Myxococcales bacterium]
MTRASSSPDPRVGGAWSHSTRDVLELAQVDADRGLSVSEVLARRRAHGPNTLRAAKRRGALSIAVAQLESFIVALLAVAAIVAFAFGHLVEGAAVVAVIVINAALGFFTELRAVRSMEALRQLGSVEATVRRDGELTRVSAQDLVVGDIVLVEGGDVVTADLRLVDCSRISVNEAALTGESAPVRKDTAALPSTTPLAERRNMLYKGTSIAVGAGEGVVVATGMRTELGRITALVQRSDDDDTPLERRLDRFGRTVALISVAFVVVVGAVGLLSGKAPLLVIETALALAVAAVPEGLPIVATIALARGMWRMARHSALLHKLAAVETLGSTSVILTDKTGTLTENRMSVARVALAGRTVSLDSSAAPDDALLARVLRAAALCTDASLTRGAAADVGDPTELSLLAAAERAGLDIGALRAAYPELREEAFDPRVKLMATFHGHAGRQGQLLVAVKGAPEAVLSRCVRVALDAGTRPLDERAREQWAARAAALGDEGLRLLAVAERHAADISEPPYERLTLLGFVCLVDPPRAEVRDAIARCHRAGVRVVMVTGDLPTTARYVARAVGLLRDDAASTKLPVERDQRVALGSALEGPLDEQATRRLLDATVVARTSPEQKLRLVELYKRSGQVAAMLGDGVNDAPALVAADIGVAMGRRGTQVAREAADMVLQDDRLRSVTIAIEQGRVIFDNIRRFVLYLLSCNLSEIAIVGTAALLGTVQPILPLQILFLNLVTDVFPALALGVSEGERDIMRRPPRDAREPVLTRHHWLLIVLFGLLLTAATLGALGVALGPLHLPERQAVTISFLVAGLSQVCFAFAMSSARTAPLRNEVTGNAWLWAAAAWCTLLLLAAAYLPGLKTIMHASAPGLDGWLLVLAASLAPLLITLGARAALARRAPLEPTREGGLS